MATNFPTSLDNSTSLPYPSSGNFTNAPSLAGLNDNQNDALIATQTKLGIGASTPTSGKFLTGTGIGTSAWANTVPAGTVVGTSDSQTLTNKTLTSPTISSPVITNATISTDLITGYTTSNTGTVYGIPITTGVINTAGTINGASLVGGSVATAAIANNAITTALIADGAITPAKLLAGTGTSWTWQSWTPTWGGLTIGNATVNCQYVQIGKTVIAKVNVTLGSTSSVSALTTLSLPVTAVTPLNADPCGTFNFSVASTVYQGYGQVLNTTQLRLVAFQVSGTYLTQAGFTATVPNTWAAGSIINGYITYQAA